MYESDYEREEKWRETQRLKDAFIAAAQVRPATAEHYQAWLEAHLDNGGKIDSYAGNFRKGDYVTVSKDAQLPPALYGSSSMHIIVPSGVTLTAPDRGHCDIFYIDGGKASQFVTATVYRENIPSMVDRGYKLGDLLPASDWKDMVEVAARNAALGGTSGTLQENLSALGRSTVQQLDKTSQKVQTADIESLVRKDLGLPATAVIDPVYLQVIEDTRQDMLNTIAAQRYKNDPTALVPLPSLLKPKTSAAAVTKEIEEIKSGSSDAITIRKPFTLKSAAPAPVVQESAPAAAGDTSSAPASQPPKKGFAALLKRVLG